MRAYILLACACATLTGPATGQQTTPKKAETAVPQSSPSPATVGVTNVLEDRIRAEWEAFKKKDKKTYGELLADDYVAVEADGDGERNKAQMLREIEHSMITEYTLSFLKVTPLGPEAAFARYEVFFRFPPKSAVPFEKVLIGEVWIKRNGQWKALHYQETRVK